MINTETEVNCSQVCRECKSYYHNFKVDIDKVYDENGSVSIKTSELYEKFSFICRFCGLLNILNFNQICSKETVFFLRKKAKETKKS